MINRRKYCIANFKMNKNREESKEYIQSISTRLLNDGYLNDDGGDKIRMIVCPPFHSLDICQVREVVHNGFYLGAQNVSQFENGPYTGEISASMLYDIGSEYVIIGHSERRAYFDESNEDINKKINLALKYYLEPIFCIGETLEQRQNNLMKATLKEQLTKGLNGIRGENIILAYEPVWAIGTGETATSAIITEAHRMIRNILNDIGFDGEKISILYGGSVNRNNAKELIELEGVDGFLIGGASLDVEHFYDIYKFIEESI
tara:strand:- start:382 stop:1164 length:783 start_codon:yes stop_codon:yes gene_type:complete